MDWIRMEQEDERRCNANNLLYKHQHKHADDDDDADDR